MNDSVGAVIVAAGMGTRLGEPIPKAFVPLANLPLFAHSLVTLERHEQISSISVVVPPGFEDRARSIIDTIAHSHHVAVLAGGDHRVASVKNGVLAVDTKWILVHDAARPFLTIEVIDTLLALRSSYQCAVTATPVVDTIRRVVDGHSDGTIDRSTLVRVGTPQLFHREMLLGFLDAIRLDDPTLTDEAMLFERAGICVGIAKGDPLNTKVTTPQDLMIAEALYARRAAL